MIEIIKDFTNKLKGSRTSVSEIKVKDLGCFRKRKAEIFAQHRDDVLGGMTKQGPHDKYIYDEMVAKTRSDLNILDESANWTKSAEPGKDRKKKKNDVDVQ